jgi:hypothetical protein
MSIKIYEAYRVPTSRLNEFIKFFSNRQIELKAIQIRRLMGAVKDEIVEAEIADSNVISRATNVDQLERYREAIRFNHVIGSAKEAAEKPYRSVIDAECGLHFHILGKYAYLRPYSSEWESGIEVPDWVDDYSYWNNTDQPENVSDDEWDERRETWSKTDKEPCYNYKSISLNKNDYSSMGILRRLAYRDNFIIDA